MAGEPLAQRPWFAKTSLAILERDTSNGRVLLAGMPMMQNHAPTIYAYPSLDALFNGEAAGGAKAALPGASGKPVTERPASGSDLAMRPRL